MKRKVTRRGAKQSVVRAGSKTAQDTPSTRQRQYKSFKAARRFARSLKLSSYRDWKKFVSSMQRTEDIPMRPDVVYKHRGWDSWSDWLGTSSISSLKREYRSFDEVKSFVRSLGLKSQLEWARYCESGKKPPDIPANLCRTYMDKGWAGWGNFLGTGQIANKNKTFLDFENARRFVHRLGIKSVAEWRDLCRSGSRPQDIPTHPHIIYRDEWINWGDWLGTGVINSRQRKYRSFTEAREYVQQLRLKSAKAWTKYTRSSKRPEDIPAYPDHIYRNKGWKSWDDWLRTGAVGGISNGN